MIRSEAIIVLNNLRNYYSNRQGGEVNAQALEFAISSLLTDEAYQLEYEPTTKNDLGVREFEEIVVEFPPEDLCTYPEYKGKPYFGIKYKEGNDHIIGYGTYNPKILSRYLRDYFMPSVTPREPILDKIRAEIEKTKTTMNMFNREDTKQYAMAMEDVLKILDKYKAESEK